MMPFLSFRHRSFLQPFLFLVFCFCLQFISSISFGFHRFQPPRIHCRPFVTGSLLSLAQLNTLLPSINSTLQYIEPLDPDRGPELDLNATSTTLPDTIEFNETSSSFLEEDQPVAGEEDLVITEDTPDSDDQILQKLSANAAEVEKEPEIIVEYENIFLPEKTENETNHFIKIDEMKHVLSNAQHLLSLNDTEIASLGWKMIFQTPQFSVFKRKAENDNNKKQPDPNVSPLAPTSVDHGGIEYLLKGSYDDISPQSFLKVQLKKKFRKLFDQICKEMSCESIAMDNYQMINQTDSLGRVYCHVNPHAIVFPDNNTSDVVYFRSKWPWPLKDRDYVLARRCKVFDEDNAVVYITKSKEDQKFPHLPGVVRVEKYWSQSAIFSKHPVHRETYLSSPIDENSSPQNIEEMMRSVHQQEHCQQPRDDISPESSSSSPMIRPKQPPPAMPPSLLHRHARTAAGATAKGIDRARRVQFLPNFMPRPVVNTLRKPGVNFVTIFRDDSQVSLPKTISSMVEKSAADSMNRMYEAAKKSDQNIL